jgi:hypothetical protein
MRGRLITNVPGLNPDGSPFARLQQLARMIVKVSKADADGIVVAEKKPTPSRQRNTFDDKNADKEKS